MTARNFNLLQDPPNISETTPSTAEFFRESVPSWPSEEEALAGLSHMQYPAWTKFSFLHPRACPDAQAWRTLATRIRLFANSHNVERQQLLVSLRKWKPPMEIAKPDPDTAATLGLHAAAQAQRKYWKKLRLIDFDTQTFEGLEQAAITIAMELEKRYKQLRSVAWANGVSPTWLQVAARWCTG